MAIPVSYTKFSFSPRPISAADYYRIKNIPKDQYLSDLWVEVKAQKAQYHASRAHIRLITIIVFIISLLWAGLFDLLNSDISAIGVLAAFFCIFIWISEFLSVSSLTATASRQYDYMRVIKEVIDESKDYEEYTTNLDNC